MDGKDLDGLASGRSASKSMIGTELTTSRRYLWRKSIPDTRTIYFWITPLNIRKSMITYAHCMIKIKSKKCHFFSLSDSGWMSGNQVSGGSFQHVLFWKILAKRTRCSGSISIVAYKAFSLNVFYFQRLPPTGFLATKWTLRWARPFTHACSTSERASRPTLPSALLALLRQAIQTFSLNCRLSFQSVSLSLEPRVLHRRCGGRSLPKLVPHFHYTLCELTCFDEGWLLPWSPSLVIFVCYEISKDGGHVTIQSLQEAATDKWRQLSFFFSFLLSGEKL